MKAIYAMASAAALSLYLAAPAGAVDIRDPRYGDNMEHSNLTITENGQSRTIVLMNGETIFNACTSECTIQPQGGKAVTASNYDMVEVAGSSAKLYKFPVAYTTTNPQLAQLPQEQESQDPFDAMASPENSPEGGGGSGDN